MITYARKVELKALLDGIGLNTAQSVIDADISTLTATGMTEEEANYLKAAYATIKEVF
jgi:hypothetical protein